MQTQLLIIKYTRMFHSQNSDPLQPNSFCSAKIQQQLTLNFRRAQSQPEQAMKKETVHGQDENYDRGLVHNQRIDDDQYYVDYWEEISALELEDTYHQNQIEKQKEEVWEILQLPSNYFQEEEEVILTRNSEEIQPQEEMLTQGLLLLSCSPVRTKSEDITYQRKKSEDKSGQGWVRQTLTIRKHSLNEYERSYELAIQAIDRDVFIKIDKMVAQVDKKLIDFITESFLEMGLPTLMVDDRIYDQDYADKFWCLYFAYLNDLDQKELKKIIFKYYKCKKGFKPKNLHGGWEFSLASLTDYLFDPNYSKAKIMKENLQAKYRILQHIRGKLKYRCEEEKDYVLQQMLKQMAHLEIVQSFQRVLFLCRKQERKDKFTTRWRQIGKVTQRR